MEVVDYEAWRDIVQLLEGCDTSDELFAALLSSDGAGAVSTAPSASDDGDEKTDVAPAPNKRKKRSANTTRQTLLRLRETVKDAEAQLDLLRSRRKQHRPNGDTRADASVVAVWKDVATRQYRWRRESEVAREKLRAVVQEQAKIVCNLERLIKRSRHVLQSNNPMTFAPVDIDGIQYARRVEDLMAVTTDMFIEMPFGFGSGLSDPDHERWMNNSVDVHRRVVPCSTHAVTSAVWNYFTRSTGESESYFRERIDTSSDCVVKSFHVRWNNTVHAINHRGIVVARRFQCRDGTDVIVYTAELETLNPEVSVEETTPVANGFRTHVWTIVGPSTDTQEYSEVVIKNVTTSIAPEKSSPAPPIRTATSKITRFAQFSLSQHFERVMRAVDSAFLSPGALLVQ